MSYDTTGNNIIIPVSKKIVKLTTTLKKKKSDQTGKENNDVEYILFRNEIIETIEKAEAISVG